MRPIQYGTPPPAEATPLPERYVRRPTSDITWEVVDTQEDRVVSRVLYCEHKGDWRRFCPQCGAKSSQRFSPRDVVTEVVRLLVLGIAIAGAACGASSPTSPDTTVLEDHAVAEAERFGKVLELGPLGVTWEDRLTPEGSPAWAFPGARTVHLNRSWVNSQAPIDITWVVAHEACHVALGWLEPPVLACQARIAG